MILHCISPPALVCPEHNQNYFLFSAIQAATRVAVFLSANQHYVNTIVKKLFYAAFGLISGLITGFSPKIKILCLIFCEYATRRYQAFFDCYRLQIGKKQRNQFT
ncbi:MAG: hypothetical protein HDT15_05180 [Oscillibacter sp.]|nr:hypothetical protein [Oscillibacter sp.]